MFYWKIDRKFLFAAHTAARKKEANKNENHFNMLKGEIITRLCWSKSTHNKKQKPVKRLLVLEYRMDIYIASGGWKNYLFRHDLQENHTLYLVLMIINKKYKSKFIVKLRSRNTKNEGWGKKCITFMLNWCAYFWKFVDEILKTIH